MGLWSYLQMHFFTFFYKSVKLNYGLNWMKSGERCLRISCIFEIEKSILFFLVQIIFLMNISEVSLPKHNIVFNEWPTHYTSKNRNGQFHSKNDLKSFRKRCLNSIINISITSYYNLEFVWRTFSALFLQVFFCLSSKIFQQTSSKQMRKHIEWYCLCAIPLAKRRHTA